MLLSAARPLGVQAAMAGVENRSVAVGTAAPAQGVFASLLLGQEAPPAAPVLATGLADGGVQAQALLVPLAIAPGALAADTSPPPAQATATLDLRPRTLVLPDAGQTAVRRETTEMAEPQTVQAKGPAPFLAGSLALRADSFTSPILGQRSFLAAAAVLREPPDPAGGQALASGPEQALPAVSGAALRRVALARAADTREILASAAQGSGIPADPSPPMPPLEAATLHAQSKGTALAEPSDTSLPQVPAQWLFAMQSVSLPASPQRAVSAAASSAIARAEVSRASSESLAGQSVDEAPTLSAANGPAPSAGASALAPAQPLMPFAGVPEPRTGSQTVVPRQAQTARVASATGLTPTASPSSAAGAASGDAVTAVSRDATVPLVPPGEGLTPLLPARSAPLADALPSVATLTAQADAPPVRPYAAQASPAPVAVSITPAAPATLNMPTPSLVEVGPVGESNTVTTAALAHSAAPIAVSAARTPGLAPETPTARADGPAVADAQPSPSQAPAPQAPAPQAAQTAARAGDELRFASKPAADAVPAPAADPRVVAEAASADADLSVARRERATPGSQSHRPEAAPAASAGAALTPSDTVTVPAGTAPAAAQQVADQVKYWIQNGIQNAELKFDGLGPEPVQVSITLSGNEAQVVFRSDQAPTRELLGSAIAQLEQSLRSEGLALSGAWVGSSASQGEQRQQAQPAFAAPAIASVTPQAPAAPVLSPRRIASEGGVDLFV